MLFAAPSAAVSPTVKPLPAGYACNVAPLSNTLPPPNGVPEIVVAFSVPAFIVVSPVYVWLVDVCKKPEPYLVRPPSVPPTPLTSFCLSLIHI